MTLTAYVGHLVNGSIEGCLTSLHKLTIELQGYAW